MGRLWDDLKRGPHDLPTATFLGAFDTQMPDKTISQIERKNKTRIGTPEARDR
jgi:hypothetical protein